MNDHDHRKSTILGSLLTFIFVAFLCACAFSVRAGDGQGAYTAKNAVSEGYIADIQTGSFCVGLDGSDDLTGLEAPWTKMAGMGRIFRLHDPNSSSAGTKLVLSLTAKFSNAAATADVWVAYYYNGGDEADDSDYELIALDRPLGGKLTATAAVDDGRYVALTSTLDGYGATHAVVLVTAVSAGTVDLNVGSR